MKKLSDFQSSDVPRTSISEGISIDVDDNDSSEHSNSQNSLDDESFDDSTGISSGKSDQITVKVSSKDSSLIWLYLWSIGIVRYQRSARSTSIWRRECHVSIYIHQLQRRPNNCFHQTIHWWRRWRRCREKATGLCIQSRKSQSFDRDFFEYPSIRFLFQEYTFSITDNFLSICLESAISIEVWYHYSSIPLSISTNNNNERNRRDAEIRALSNRWKEVKRHIQYAVEIHELDASGRWEPVEVDAQQSQIISGGVYRLRQVNKRQRHVSAEFLSFIRVNRNV